MSAWPDNLATGVYRVAMYMEAVELLVLWSPYQTCWQVDVRIFYSE